MCITSYCCYVFLCYVFSYFIFLLLLFFSFVSFFINLHTMQWVFVFFCHLWFRNSIRIKCDQLYLQPNTVCTFIYQWAEYIESISLLTTKLLNPLINKDGYYSYSNSLFFFIHLKSRSKAYCFHKTCVLIKSNIFKQSNLAIVNKKETRISVNRNKWSFGVASL